MSANKKRRSTGLGSVPGNSDTTTRKQKGNAQEISPVAVLNTARHYARAAAELRAVAQGGDHSTAFALEDPTYFLAFHATELALKAYLRSHGIVRRGHNLTRLHQECRRLGLHVDSEIGSVVGLLDSGNEDQAFRYFTLKSTTTAGIEWVLEALEKLIQAVARVVETPESLVPGPAIKARLTFGRGVPKRPK